MAVKKLNSVEQLARDMLAIAVMIISNGHVRKHKRSEGYRLDYLLAKVKALAPEEKIRNKDLMTFVRVWVAQKWVKFNNRLLQLTKVGEDTARKFAPEKDPVPA